MNIPLVKHGKLSAVRSLLLRHLTSAEVEGEDDKGLAVFQDVLQQIQAKLETRAAVEVASTTGERNMVMLEQIRLNKEFKLGGTVGDGKNCLGYGTIYYRMLDGKNNGFKPKERSWLV